MSVVNINNKYIIMMTDDSESNNDIRVPNSDILTQGVYRIKHIASVNSMYIDIGTGKKCLDPSLVDDRYKIWNQLEIAGHNPNEIPNDDSKLTLEFGFYLTNNINKRDIDNMFKFNLDTLAEFYHFNDNRVFQIGGYKKLVEKYKEEMVYYRIRKSNLDLASINGALLKR